jgi:glycosyltransferase involved in cell wall biosynthesis
VTRFPLAGAQPVIGIDASRLSVSERTGTETYTWETLRAMAEIEPDAQIRLYLNAPSLPPSADLPWEAIPMPFPRLWTHARLSWEMARRPPALLWVPAHVVPAIHPRSVVTVHDLGYLHYPEGHTQTQRRLLDLTTRWSVRAAKHIVAISKTTRNDLVERYGVDASRITIIPHGVSERFAPPSPEDVRNVRAGYGLPDTFVLAVGTVQPRKNYDGLAQSMASFARLGLPHALVIAGKPGWMAHHMQAAIDESGYHRRVTMLGYVPQEDLPALYGAADVVAFPSWYEGFGLPALEAMRCGAPVVVSNRGALPEIVADAALIADPADPATFGERLVAVATNPELRSALVERGKRHAAQFTWRETAEMTLELLRQQAGIDGVKTPAW